MTELDERAPRKDAQQNRDRLLEVARDLIESDPTVSLNAIAKAAGVGAGTLYRHFPNREALILALYQHQIDNLVGLADTLLAQNPPRQAMRLWLMHLARYGRVKHGISDLLHAAMTADVSNSSYAQMVKAVEKLLAASGSDAAITGEDLLLLLGYLWRLPPGPEGVERGQRLTDFILVSLGLAE